MKCKVCGGEKKGTYKDMCYSCYDKNYYQKNKEAEINRVKKWNKKNIEKYRKNCKNYILNHREKDREIQKRWKDISNYDAKYYIINKQQINKRNYIYQKQREKVDINYKLRRWLSCRINSAIKNNGTKKSIFTIKLLGCTIQKCREHIENHWQEGMNWSNHGLHGWHIDHIIPCASFDLIKEEEQLKCFHYTNLQPLWAQENLRKSNKLNWETTNRKVTTSEIDKYNIKGPLKHEQTEIKEFKNKDSFGIVEGGDEEAMDDFK